MVILRPHLLAFLILLILPWGAYFAGPVAAAPHNITVDAPEAREIIASLPKTCRIAVLPGSPCAPDLALPALHQAPVVTKTAPDTSIPSAVLGQGRSPAPSRDPPRAA